MPMNLNNMSKTRQAIAIILIFLALIASITAFFLIRFGTFSYAPGEMPSPVENKPLFYCINGIYFRICFLFGIVVFRKYLEFFWKH
jgi:hypothetical protein